MTYTVSGGALNSTQSNPSLSVFGGWATGKAFSPSKTSASKHVGMVVNVRGWGNHTCLTATDLWIKPTDLSHSPACRQLGNHICHRHLLLLSLKANTHYTIPQRVEG